MDAFFDLRSAVEGIAALFYPKAEARGVDLTCVVQRDVAAVQGDVVRLEAALGAMVNAALELVERGDLVLTVHRDGKQKNRGAATIGFRVSGREAPSTSRRDKFLPDSDRVRSVLSQAQHAVAAAGGELRARALASGAADLRFSVAFTAASHSEHRIGRLERLADLRVLVVDDAEPRRRSLRELLAACGCSVQTAPGALQAMEILRTARATAHPIRLLLISSELIEIPAAVFCRSVRNDPCLGVARLILVSPPRRGSDPGDIAADGFGGELIRPVTRASLLTLVAPESRSRRSVSVAELASRGGEGGRRRRARVLLAEDMLDFADLLRRLDRDMDAVSALLDIFTRNLGETLANLEKALGLGDKEQMRRAAHAVKGMARNVSATHLADLAGRVEQLAREDRLDAASALLTELNQCRERTEARIRQLMRSPQEIAYRYLPDRVLG